MTEVEVLIKLRKSPISMMKVMKQYPILAYNPEKRAYIFSSKVFEVATKQFLFEEDDIINSDLIK